MKTQRLERDKLDFGNGKISTLFKALFFPTLVGMIFNSALTVIDGIFTGHGVGSDGIAAVNIVAPLFMVCTGIGLMFGIGASVVASIRLSENNEKGARIILTQAFSVGSAIIAILCLICLLFASDIAGMLGCSERLEDKALSYMLWLLPGLLFLFPECVGMMLIRLDGSPRYAMWVQIVAALLNIVLDWYMIFPLGMGVRGAAMATSIACAAGGIMVIVYFIRFSDKLRFYRPKFTITSMLLTCRNVWYMIRIGSATFLTEVAMSVMMLTGNYMFMSMLHEEGVAAFAIACYLFPIVFSISNAVAQSAQPIISYNYGARKEERVAKALRVSIFTAIICGISVTLLLWAGARPTAAMFLNPQTEAYGIAVKGLPLFAICATFFAINIAFIGYYQSIEKAALSAFCTLLRGIVLLVPSFVFLPALAGVAGLWLAIPAAEAATAAIITVLYLRSRLRSRHVPHAATGRG